VTGTELILGTDTKLNSVTGTELNLGTERKNNIFHVVTMP